MMFNISLNLTAGQSHEVSLYAVDWDNRGRSERIDVLDAASGRSLNSETLSSFSGGEYLSWTLSGNVKLEIHAAGGGQRDCERVVLRRDARGPGCEGQRPLHDRRCPGGVAIRVGQRRDGSVYLCVDLGNTGTFSTPGQDVSDTILNAGDLHRRPPGDRRGRSHGQDHHDDHGQRRGADGHDRRVVHGVGGSSAGASRSRDEPEPGRHGGRVHLQLEFWGRDDVQRFEPVEPELHLCGGGAPTR